MILFKPIVRNDFPVNTGYNLSFGEVVLTFIGDIKCAGRHFEIN